MEKDLQLIGAVDQGTSSTRFLVFNSKTAELLSYHQIEVTQLLPNEGWMEEDPMEILASVHTCIEQTIKNLEKMKIAKTCIRAIGVTNQRETTIMWDKITGNPLHNAIVWCDNRTQTTVENLIEKCPNRNQDHLKEWCGLPISTYFSAVKLRWLLDNKPDVRQAVEDRRAYFGTVDSWLLWNLTGGVKGKGKHITDVTNASRTMLFNIHTQKWDDNLLKFFDIPKHILPLVKSSAELYGHMNEGVLAGVPLCGCLGDQQAALVGQTCFSSGDLKNTYGTGCFLLLNTGLQPVLSKHGLLTTIAYKLGKDEPTYYALEGSIAVAGGAVQWLRDNLGIIKKSREIETLANMVKSSGDIFFVPAFSGLYAPYWRSDARGIICGLTQWTTKAHIAYATLEAVCYQTREIIEAMQQDACSVYENEMVDKQLSKLKVDGGMTNNKLLMQLQANILGCTVLKPSMPETTALGVAMAAGKAFGIWNLAPKDLTAVTFERFEPNTSKKEIQYNKWKLAVQKAMGWHSVDSPKSENAPDNNSSVLQPSSYFALSPITFSAVVIVCSFAFILFNKKYLNF